MMKSLVPPLTRLARMPQILSRVPIQVSSLLVQTLACCPTSLGVDYQRDSMVQPHESFHDVCFFINFSFTT